MNTCDGFDFRIEVRPWRETAYIALVHVVRHDSAKRTVVLPWPDGALSPNFFATPAEAEVACRTSVSLMKQSGEASTLFERCGSDVRYAVIEFQRALCLPRFSMACGERWGFEFSAERIERLLDILHGDRFDFAGGQVISRDVAVLYVGPHGLDGSLAQSACHLKIPTPRGGYHLHGDGAHASTALCSGEPLGHSDHHIHASDMAMNIEEMRATVCPKCIALYSTTFPTDRVAPLWLQRWRAGKASQGDPPQVESLGSAATASMTQ